MLLSARQSDGAIAYSQGFFSVLSRTTCGDQSVEEVVTTIPLNRSMLGGGAFDLEGSFLGMALECNSRLAIISGTSIRSLLQRAVSEEARWLRIYGVRLSNLDPRAALYFHTPEGVLVHEVSSGSPADRAGVIPGDIITVWDEVAVRNMDDLTPLLQSTSEGTAAIDVLRGRRVVKTTLETVPGGWWRGAKSPTDMLLRLEPPVSGYVIESTVPGSPAYSAGLRAGDRVLQIDGRAVSHQQAVESIRNATDEKPLYVLVSRADKKIGVILP